MATPTKLKNAIWLEDIAFAEFGRSRIDSIELDVCIRCGESATKFNDTKSKERYELGGFCQECQLLTFTYEETPTNKS